MQQDKESPHTNKYIFENEEYFEAYLSLYLESVTFLP